MYRNILLMIMTWNFTQALSVRMYLGKGIKNSQDLIIIYVQKYINLFAEQQNEVHAQKHFNFFEIADLNFSVPNARVQITT